MLDAAVLDKLAQVEQRFERLTQDLGNPDVISDQRRFQQAGRERSQLEPLIQALTTYRRMAADIADHEGLLGDKDPELRELARSELGPLRERLAALSEALKILLLPKDPNDDRNVMLEVRAGTGGDEAGLFAAEVLRMYLRFCERKRWKVEMLSRSDSGIGGIKEAVASVLAAGAYSQLKYEGGVHRVQRVPSTETQGRIHTSTVTVAVLPEAEEIDIKIEEKDIRVDVMRQAGAELAGRASASAHRFGGAHRTHLASGLVVQVPGTRRARSRTGARR